MPRLIDVDALFNWGEHKLSDAIKYGNKDKEQQHWSYSTLMMYEVSDEIDAAPTVDAVPVVHGEWIPFEEQCFFTIFDGIQCSVCGSKHNTELAREYKYCPNCGAKMDLEDKPCQP